MRACGGPAGLCDLQMPCISLFTDEEAEALQTATGSDLVQTSIIGTIWRHHDAYVAESQYFKVPGWCTTYFKSCRVTSLILALYICLMHHH